jgi:hypothetical protein
LRHTEQVGLKTFLIKIDLPTMASLTPAARCQTADLAGVSHVEVNASAALAKCLRFLGSASVPAGQLSILRRIRR